MSKKKLGVSRIDITPPLGVGMRGYNVPNRDATHVWDPLYLNTVVFEENGKKAAVVVCDLLGLYDEMPFEIIAEIAKEQDMDAQSIFICNTHSHTAPYINFEGESDPTYDAFFRKKVKDSVALAIRDLKPVTETLSTTREAPDITITRRFLDSDGTFLMRSQLKTHPNAVYGSVTDDNLQTTVFVREGGPQVIMVNFAMHPDNVGGTGISADFPGAMRKMVEANVPNSFCIFFNGGEGNLVGKDAMTGGPLSKRIMTSARGTTTRAYADGKALACDVIKSMFYLEPTEDTPLFFKEARALVPTVRDREKLAWAKRVWDLHYAGRDEEYLKPGEDMNSVFSQARNQIRLDNEDLDEQELPISVITFGGLALVGFPGEPFCELGIALREASPFTRTYLCCQCNRSYNYLATEKAYDEGGYEVANSRFKKGVGEALVKLAVDTLQELYEGK